MTKMTLQELRRKKYMTQNEVAKAMGVIQSNVDGKEDTVDMRVSSLRRYIEALGGNLVLTAVFDDFNTEVILKRRFE